MVRSPETEFFQALNGTWWWRIRHPDGRILATSSEGYRRRLDCVEAYRTLKEMP